MTEDAVTMTCDNSEVDLWTSHQWICYSIFKAFQGVRSGAWIHSWDLKAVPSEVSIDDALIFSNSSAIKICPQRK